MKITSPAFNHNERIPSRHTCDGENINPSLLISGVPREAVILVLIVDDPDAPMGNWTHWTVWNVPAETKEIPEGSVPMGAVEGMTSFGKPGYGGPCPPGGTHRYFWKLFGLDIALHLDRTASKDDLESSMHGHVIASAELLGLYGREK